MDGALYVAVSGHGAGQGGQRMRRYPSDVREGRDCVMAASATPE